MQVRGRAVQTADIRLGEAVPVEVAERHPLPHWKVIARMPEDELGRVDVSFAQFVAHMGLPGSENLDPWECFRKKKAITARVRTFTDRAMDRFRRRPSDFEDSEAYFRALCLATVLQKEFGVRYDPTKIPRDVPFGVEDTTAHGILFGNGGTCASLPVLYASVGRALGYPLKLVSCYVTRDITHLFARWDGPDDRFNIETTGTGLCAKIDEDYRTGKYSEMTPECERLGRFMLSKTPRMELAGFLQSRALHWMRAGNKKFRTETLAWAFALDPLNKLREDQLKLSLNDWTSWTEGLQPPGFPSITIGHPRGHRFFPDTLPWDYEHQIMGLMAVDRLLSDPQLQKVWQKMFAGQWKGRGPNRALIDFRPDGTSEETLEFNAS
jgi:hypothetical protein